MAKRNEKEYEWFRTMKTGFTKKGKIVYTDSTGATIPQKIINRLFRKYT